jgi:hypothetical protein
MKITLDDFLRSGDRNAWVIETGFKGLYVRHGPRIINKTVLPVLDLATIEVEKPNHGTFTRLVTRLHPRHHLYVENALESRFQKRLEKLGFHRATIPMCYYLRTWDVLWNRIK